MSFKLLKNWICELVNAVVFIVGGNDRASSKILLDKTLGYVVKITNTSASAIKAVLGIDWYRHN